MLNPEQIEISVVPMDSEMIIIQPADLNNLDVINVNPQVPQAPVAVYDLTGEANNDVVPSPNNKKRKR